VQNAQNAFICVLTHPKGKDKQTYNQTKKSAQMAKTMKNSKPNYRIMPQDYTKAKRIAAYMTHPESRDCNALDLISQWEVRRNTLLLHPADKEHYDKRFLQFIQCAQELEYTPPSDYEKINLLGWKIQQIKEDFFRLYKAKNSSQWQAKKI
jgi:hypothetical protein